MTGAVDAAAAEGGVGDVKGSCELRCSVVQAGVGITTGIPGDLGLRRSSTMRAGLGVVDGLALRSGSGGGARRRGVEGGVVAGSTVRSGVVATLAVGARMGECRRRAGAGPGDAGDVGRLFRGAWSTLGSVPPTPAPAPALAPAPAPAPGLGRRGCA